MSADAEDALETIAVKAAGNDPRGDGIHRVPRSRWLECLDHGERPSIFQHPDIVSNRVGSDGRSPILIPCCDERFLPSFGLLTYLPYRVKLFPTKYGSWLLRGHKLLDSRLIGEESEQTSVQFADSIDQLLASGQTDCIYIEDVEVETPLWKAVHKRRRGFVAFHPSTPQPHWWIDFPVKPEEYWRKFSKKTRYNLRSSARKLDHAVVCYRDVAPVVEFLEKAAAVSANSWQGHRLGPRINREPQTIHFWRTVASLGALRAYVLEHEGQPIAFHLAVQWKGCFMVIEIGYDKRYAASSPGLVLLYRILEDLVSRDTPKTLDFGFGDAEYKRVFGTRQTASGPVLLVRRKCRCLIPMWLQGGRRRVSLACRWALGRLGLKGIVRRWYRGLRFSYFI